MLDLMFHEYVKDLEERGLDTDDAWSGSIGRLGGADEQAQPAETHQERVAALTGQGSCRHGLCPRLHVGEIICSVDQKVDDWNK